MSIDPVRPPSVDALARELATSFALPHIVLVDCARRAIQSEPQNATHRAHQLADDFLQMLQVDVVNATGVLLHSNLGRAPLPQFPAGRATSVEFNMGIGERGSRHQAVSQLVSLLTGAEAAIVVNNNAAALVLVLTALAQGRDVAVSRGESVEIGGGFRIPDVMEQSGARLIDVGTTNKTRYRDYEKALHSKRNDIALVMKIHPSNFSIEGFTENVSIRELSQCEVPVVADIGSGLLDNTCPWLNGHLPSVPQWLSSEPAAKQALHDGASLVTFSGDKLLGGPQCGVIAGNKELVDACASHPLMRALRPSGHTMMWLQTVLLSYCARTVCDDVPFWNMVSQSTDSLCTRAQNIVSTSKYGHVVPLTSLVGAGSAPGTSLESYGVEVDGDCREQLRSLAVPVIARTRDGNTFLDLRSVHPDDDSVIINALQHISPQ
jgi:L-seryl-tRNA(Ser) seleniumtransferase